MNRFNHCRFTPPNSVALLLFVALFGLLPGGAAGSAVTVRDSSGNSVDLFTGSYALVIGASNYESGWSRLPGVVDDVKAVHDALTRHGFKVDLVMDPNHDELERSIEGFIAEYGLRAENRLIIYFAGHGETLKLAGGDMGFIVPIDAPNPHRDRIGFLARAINMQQIEVYANANIQAKHALFLFDSCFSGTIFGTSRSSSVPESIIHKSSQKVRQFITSGSADEEVPDNSIFRRQLIAGLNGEADLDRDGYVLGTELGAFLEGQVIDSSRNRQHPQHGKIYNPLLNKGDFVFVLPNAKAADVIQGGTPRYQSYPSAARPSVSQVSRVDHAEINRLLRLANKHLRQFRLTTPKRRNATDLYREILTMDPGNSEAEQGLWDVADRYQRLARTAKARGKLKKAAGYVESGLSVQPDHDGLIELQIALVDEGVIEDPTPAAPVQAASRNMKSDSPSQAAAPPQPQRYASLDGYWVRRGVGDLLIVNGDLFQAWRGNSLTGEGRLSVHGDLLVASYNDGRTDYFRYKLSLSSLTLSDPSHGGSVVYDRR